jgi:hypothetical protein
MAHLSTTAAGGFDKNPVIISLSDDAKELIEKFEKGLKDRLLSDKFKPKYSSVDDILVKKFHLTDIENLDFPDYKDKTEFISNGVRGNLQKIDGNVLNYFDGEVIINEAINTDIP